MQWQCRHERMRQRSRKRNAAMNDGSRRRSEGVTCSNFAALGRCFLAPPVFTHHLMPRCSRVSGQLRCDTCLERPPWDVSLAQRAAAFSRARRARCSSTSGRQPKHRQEPSRYSSRRVARAFGRFSMVAQRPRANLSTELLVGFSARKHLQFQSNGNCGAAKR